MNSATKTARQVLAAAAAATALTAAGAAGATVIDVYATGTVDEGSDWTTLFPTAGAIGGLTFVYNATYDLSAGKPVGFPVPNPNTQDFAPTAYSASLTIGGDTLLFGGGKTGSGATVADNFDEEGELLSFLDNSVFQNHQNAEFQLVADDPGALLLQPLYGDLCDNGHCGDGVDVIYTRPHGTLDAIVQLQTAHFIVSAAGVPEPAAWSLMLLGFGGLGAALRRRRAGGGLSVLGLTS